MGQEWGVMHTIFENGNKYESCSSVYAGMPRACHSIPAMAMCVRRDVMPYHLSLNPVQLQAKVHGASRRRDRTSHANPHECNFSRRSAGCRSKVRAFKDTTCPMLALKKVHP